jgi:formate dehydrogenase major subunit
VNSADRLTTPLIREGDTFRNASWDEALSLVAERLAEIKRKAGPHALAFVSSSKCTNEENYLMQKLARSVIGTNNMDNCSRYCQAPATKGLSRTVGHGGDSGSIHDIAMADLVITIGSNTAESHPVLATRVKSAHKLRGQKLIVADIRKHEMAERADLFIQPRPGTDLVWISAVAKHIIDQGLHKKAFIDEWVNGFDEYYQSLAPFTLEAAQTATGLSVATLQQIAHEITSAQRVCILWAMGVTQHTMGTDTSTAISNLLLITGNYMRPGTGAYPLRGHNNVQGAGDMGAMPDKLPGYQAVDDPQIRAKFEAEWGVPLPSDKGLAKLERAPAEHAAALLDLYETLQVLHDRGALDLARGALGSGDKVLEIAVEAANSPASIRGMRNLILILNTQGAIEPEYLKTFMKIIPQTLQATVAHPEPPGLKDFLWNQDFRRGLATLNTFFEMLGRHLPGDKDATVPPDTK